MQLPPRRLLALVEAIDHVCYRYRVAAFAPALAQGGWTLEALPLARSVAGFLRQLPAIAAADAVVLQRRLLPWWRLALLRRAARVLIYDLDDAVFCRDNNRSKGPRSARRLRRFRATVRRADAVTAGNPHLAEQALVQGATGRVEQLPTCVDLALYRSAEHCRPAGDVRLVWLGSGSTVTSLQDAQPGLAAASRCLPGLELRVICDQFPELPCVRVAPRVWSAATEARELADADVGISWLPEHPWSHGKCGLKVLQYMAAGLPVVANPVAMHRSLVVHGRTGFLASTPQEWAEAIGRLAESPDLRAAMGRAGRRLVLEHYHAPCWAQRFVALLDELTLPGHVPLLREKGDRHHLPERPGGCFAQMVPVPFFPPAALPAGMPLDGFRVDAAPQGHAIEPWHTAEDSPDRATPFSRSRDHGD